MQVMRLGVTKQLGLEPVLYHLLTMEFLVNIELAI